jgi:homoserine O-succinyltransferase
MARSAVHAEPIFLRLREHQSKSSDARHVERFYRYFDEAASDKGLDALIVTGAPVEEIDFEDVRYWRELSDIFDWARREAFSTLGVCWAAMALAYLAGVEKVVYPSKLFGVFESERLDERHPIMAGESDRFRCPQSRHAGFDPATFERAVAAGKIKPLAVSSVAGPTIFESADGKFLSHIGHPEYEPERLVEEYYRDKKKGRGDVGEPANFDVEAPVNDWRAHGTVFYDAWLREIERRKAASDKG